MISSYISTQKGLKNKKQTYTRTRAPIQSRPSVSEISRPRLATHDAVDRIASSMYPPPYREVGTEEEKAALGVTWF